MTRIFVILFMMKFLLSALSLFSFANTIAQTSDSGQFIIHRHLKVVGKETYRMDRSSDGTKTYSIDCFYSDRGMDVPLKSMLVLSPSGEPAKMASKGNTARMTRINDTVTIDQNGLIIKKDSTTTQKAKPSHMFPVDGYAPATIQGLLA